MTDPSPAAPLAAVTGATGFIGNALVRRLLARGQRVRALVRPSRDASALRALGAEIVPGDVTDFWSLAPLTRGADVLYHLAAWYQFGVEDLSKIDQINRAGTENVCAAVRAFGVRRLVHCSTVGVLGNTEGRVEDENHFHPSVHGTAYTHTKFLAQQAVDRAVRNGIDAVSVLPGGVYGPGDRSIVAAMLELYLRGWLRVLMFPDATISFVHVDDVAEGLCLAAEKGRRGERYILASDILTLQEVFDRVAEVSGRMPPLFSLPVWMVRMGIPIQRWISPLFRQGPNFLNEAVTMMDGVTLSFSGDKARRELGWSPRPVAEGLSETVRWFQGRLAS